MLPIKPENSLEAEFSIMTQSIRSKLPIPKSEAYSHSHRRYHELIQKSEDMIRAAQYLSFEHCITFSEALEALKLAQSTNQTQVYVNNMPDR